MTDFDGVLRRGGQGSPTQTYAMCVYATILELASDIQFLIERRARIGVPVLLRSLLEAYVELLNIIKTPGYLEYRHSEYAKGKKTFIENALKSDNPHFAQLTKNRTECEKRIKELDQVITPGFKKRTIHKRFKDVCLEDDYKSIYFRLSLDAHHDLQAIDSGHLKQGDDKGSYVITFSQECSKRNLLDYLCLWGDIIIHSSIRLYEFCEKKELQRQMEEKLAEFLEFWNQGASSTTV